MCVSVCAKGRAWREWLREAEATVMVPSACSYGEDGEDGDLRSSTVMVGEDGDGRVQRNASLEKKNR